jgi:lysophospholipase L1-like esterase
VAAVFVAPKPATTAPTSSATTNSGSGSDSHYRSPASAAQQQQLQCELDITGVATSASSSLLPWDAYVQNVSSDGDHRCLDDMLVPKRQSTATACRCKNPTVPDFPHEPVSYQQRWQRTFQRNMDRIAQWETSSFSSSAGEAPSKNNNLDVVFLGDSITEHWVGSDLSNERPERLSGNVQVFQSLFGNATATPSATKSSTTNLLGLALGISGDRCPNLLYRLQNGELPVALQPSIFWILIGTNDVGTDQCRDSQVIAGNIAIVKYIQQERPNAKIVLNSILPRGKPNTLQVLDHWREVYQPINQALDCFVEGYQKQQQQQHDDNSNHDDDKDHGQLYFFNATDLFLTSDSQSINYTLLPDGLHPGEEGSWVWGRAMVEKIQDLLSS